jgi:dTDP-4-dehydrorhamnose 3,5-epimerase
MFPIRHDDDRGYLIKTFNEYEYKSFNLKTDFVEEYFSFSYYKVLRGLHFQHPPREHDKTVCCILGEVIDALVDLRVGSPCYGQFETFNLSSKAGNVLYIPAGVAHGFYVLSSNAIMLYNTTSLYSPEHDTGIRWNSLGIPWPDNNPIVSERDNTFVMFNDYDSPFIF